MGEGGMPLLLLKALLGSEVQKVACNAMEAIKTTIKCILLSGFACSNIRWVFPEIVEKFKMPTKKFQEPKPYDDTGTKLGWTGRLWHFFQI